MRVSQIHDRMPRFTKRNGTCTVTVSGIGCARVMPLLRNQRSFRAPASQSVHAQPQVQPAGAGGILSTFQRLPRPTIRRLVATADVFIENFKLGGLKKYGLDYESLRAVNPKLVYCSITGFGQDGPYAARAGYDFIIQGMFGMMSITGAAGGEPQKAGVAISDIFTGLYSVVAIQAALRHAEQTGQGQHIDMALFDTQISVLGNQNLNYLVSGQSPVQMGNAHMNRAPYEVVKAADGHFILAVGNDGQFQRFCAVVGLDDLPQDPDFATNAARVVNRLRLREKMAAALKPLERGALLAKLDAASVPASPINTIGEMFADPQTIARGMRMDLDDGHGNQLPSVRSPIILSQTPLAYGRPSPRLGEHTAEILAELESLNA